MIANARMYCVVPGVGELWRQLFCALADTAGVALTWTEHPPPAPISELWGREDLGAVFMCGLPFARSVPRPVIVAAPVPSAPGFEGRPQYWSELVVRADSDFELVEETFGHRIALTTMESQSGCLAALYYLMPAGGGGALYREVIAPQITPVGAAKAVITGLAEVAPIDSFAFALLQRHSPELTSQLRVIARTAPTAIPPLVASGPVPASLESAFLEAHKNTSMAALMEDLQLERFARPDRDGYDVLKRRFEAAVTFWHQHPFAASVHPAFAELASGPMVAEVRSKTT
jgi:ABC-type phosphate/phosphonate transport system substrate-binding protein